MDCPFYSGQPSLDFEPNIIYQYIYFILHEEQPNFKASRIPLDFKPKPVIINCCKSITYNKHTSSEVKVILYLLSTSSCFHYQFYVSLLYQVFLYVVTDL